MESEETTVSEARRGWSAVGEFCSHPFGPPFLDHLRLDPLRSLQTNLFEYGERNAKLL